MQREFAIAEVVKDYNDEINWWLENQKTKDSHCLSDPSKSHIIRRQERDFEAWYPVRLSHP